MAIDEAIHEAGRPIGRAEDVADVLSLPTGVLDELLKTIRKNPGEAEEAIAAIVIVGDEQIVPDFVELLEVKPPEDDFGFYNLDGVLNFRHRSDSVSDVYYRGREGEDPEVLFAKHIMPLSLMRYNDIPHEFPLARQLYDGLRKQRVWQGNKMREAYTLIGEIQSEFLYTLRFADLKPVILMDLSEKLGINKSNLCRMRKGNIAVIATENGNLELPVSFLMPSNSRVARYNAFVRFNELLQNDGVDFVTSKGRTRSMFTDGELSKELGIPRRTINKYREGVGLPTLTERLEAYESGEVKRFYIPEVATEMKDLEPRAIALPF
ncbi:hypothetical protein ACFL1B_04815 [Nanoarchaeota archaeon]